MASKIPPLSSVMGSEIVKVFVGKKRKEFDVHKQLICNASKFFSDAFNGPYKEGQEGQMYMPEDDSETFSYFIDWLYRNPIPIIEDNVDVSKKAAAVFKASEYKDFGPLTQADHQAEVARTKREKDDQKKNQDARIGEQVNKLLKLYFFGEKILINELMNRTMDRLRSGLARYDRYLGHRDIKQIYVNTNQGSMLRSFCAELLVHNLGDLSEKKLTQLVSLLADLPDLAKDFLIECKNLARFKDDMCCDWSDDGGHHDPRFRGLEELCCAFHKHDQIPDSPCYDLDHEGLYQRCLMSGFGRHGWGCSCV